MFRHITRWLRAQGVIMELLKAQFKYSSPPQTLHSVFCGINFRFSASVCVKLSQCRKDLTLWKCMQDPYKIIVKKKKPDTEKNWI